MNHRFSFRFCCLLVAALTAAAGSLFLYTRDTTAGAVKWTFKSTFYFGTEPVVGPDGTVYVGESSVDPGGHAIPCSLYALDGKTGKKKWAFKTGDSVRSLPAIGADGSVYFGSDDHNIYALNGKTGTRKWAFKTGGVVDSGPTIGLNGVIYAGSRDTKIYALDAAIGTQRWVFKTGGSINSAAAIGPDGTVFVGSEDHIVYALDGLTGKKKWVFRTDDRVETTPFLGRGGTVYVGSNDHNFYALDSRTGEQKWAFRTGSSVNSAARAVANGAVYIQSSDGYMYALDARTGSEKWESEPGASMFASSPTLGPGGTVYIGQNDGSITALDGQSGEKIWAFKTGTDVNSSPAIGADGTMYVSSFDGKVYAVTVPRLRSHAPFYNSPTAASLPASYFPTPAYLRAAHPRLQDELQALRTEGFPTTMAQLRGPEPAAGQNAAPDYDQAGKLRRSLPRDVDLQDLWETDRKTKSPLTPQQKQQALKALAAYKDILALLHRAALKPACVYPPSDLAGIPGNATLRDTVRTLDAESYFLARQGKYHEAIAAQALGYRVAEHAASGHTLIAYLVAQACKSMVRERMRDILDLAGNKPGVAREVEEALQHGAAQLDLTRALEGEVPVYARFFPPMHNMARAALRATSFAKNLKNPALINLDSGGDAVSDPIDPLAAAEKADPRLSGLTDTVLDAMLGEQLHYEQELVHDLNRPDWERAAAVSGTMKGLQDRAAQAKEKHDPCVDYALMCVSVDAECVTVDNQDRAGDRTLLCGAAVVRYHAEHSAYPDRLDQAISPVPPDPFTGHPLSYRQEKGGFVVYSVGPTGKYDGSPHPQGSREVAFRHPG